MAEIKRFRAEELFFDWKNPRLVQYNITKATSEDKVLNILWSEMAVNEIVMSILAHGFFENEAMYGVYEEDRLIIVEGNRRLAAVKAILNPEKIKSNGMQKYTQKISKRLSDELSSSLPVIVLANREEAWRYIGFKHVNGAAKWDSYAKAQYIASVHHDFGISLEDIAEQIGDENRTVLKIYQGLMVLNQANDMTSFKTSDVYNNRIYFSHIYTAIFYEGFQKFLGLNIAEIKTNPVPDDKLQNLEDTMFWIYGSASKKIKPIVKTQNPDIKYLNEVLNSREATESLRSTNDLSIALDISQDGGAVLYKSLVDAKQNLAKSLSKISYYDGNLDHLELAKIIADSADTIFSTLKNKYYQSKGQDAPKRTI